MDTSSSSHRAVEADEYELVLFWCTCFVQPMIQYLFSDGFPKFCNVADRDCHYDSSGWFLWASESCLECGQQHNQAEDCNSCAGSMLQRWYVVTTPFPLVALGFSHLTKSHRGLLCDIFDKRMQPGYAGIDMIHMSWIHSNISITAKLDIIHNWLCSSKIFSIS